MSHEKSWETGYLAFGNLDADISSILPEWKDPQILTGFDEKNEPQFRPAKRMNLVVDAIQ
jgi:hypothetical protein